MFGYKIFINRILLIFFIFVMISLYKNFLSVLVLLFPILFLYFFHKIYIKISSSLSRKFNSKKNNIRKISKEQEKQDIDNEIIEIFKNINYRYHDKNIYISSKKVSYNELELLHNINDLINYENDFINKIDIENSFQNENISIFFIMLIRKPIGYYFLEESDSTFKTYKNIRVIREYNTNKICLRDLSYHLYNMLKISSIIELDKIFNKEFLNIFNHSSLVIKEDTKNIRQYLRQEETAFEIAFNHKELYKKDVNELSKIEETLRHSSPSCRSHHEEIQDAIENVRQAIEFKKNK